MARELKLAGFVVLLVAIFIGAHAAGSHLGPVTTTHSQVSYTGNSGKSGKSGMTMNMGGGSHEPAPAVQPRDGRR